jgi:hypothetical protein
LLEVVLQPSERIELRRRAALDDPHDGSVVGGNELADVPETLGDDVEHRPIGRQGNILLEPADADAGLHRHGT